MSVLGDLQKLSAAEEFFAYLEVPFDQTVLRVARLHILRRMGDYLQASGMDASFAALEDEAVRVLCRAHLEQAYADFVKSSPIQERLFKVHKEAVAPKPAPQKAFVPLAALVSPGETQ